MKISIALSIIVIATCMGCDVFDLRKDTLPKLSNNGAGTFGCYANGRLFINDGELGYGAGVRAEVQQIGDTTGVIIYASNSKNNQSLAMSMYDLGSVKLNKAYDFSTPHFDMAYFDGADPVSCLYRDSISGTITFSRYQVSGITKIVSGSFNATAASSNCGGEVELTQGRFDISDVTHQ